MVNKFHEKCVYAKKRLNRKNKNYFIIHGVCVCMIIVSIGGICAHTHRLYYCDT